MNILKTLTTRAHESTEWEKSERMGFPVTEPLDVANLTKTILARTLDWVEN